MGNIFKIKRRTTGDAGAPATIAHGELAFNEVGEAFYYGKDSNSASSIGGKGEYLDRNTSQTVVGNKTFTSNVVLSAASTVTKATTASDTNVATTQFVQNVFAVLDGGDFGEPIVYAYFHNTKPTNGVYLWSDISNWYSDETYQTSAQSLPISSNYVKILSSNNVLIDVDTPGYVNVDTIELVNSYVTVYSNMSANFVASVSVDVNSTLALSGNVKYNQ